MKLREFLPVLMFSLLSFPVAAQIAGSRDPSFNPNGTGGNFHVFCIELQNDGKILLGTVDGNITYNGVSVEEVVRLNPDGTLDNSLNLGAGFKGGTTIRDIALQPDGKILVAGSFNSYDGVPGKGVVRLNSDGSLDPGFQLEPPVTSTAYFIHELELLPDGSILVAGQINSHSGQPAGGLVKLLSDGTRDVSFNPGGAGAFPAHVHALAVQPDGRILVGGVFETFNGVPSKLIVRLHPDGTVDNSFTIGTGIDGPLPDVESITLQPDGKILVGGKFEECNGTAVRSILRLNSDGTLDNGFNLNGFATSSTVHAIKLQPDGKIIIGGTFQKYDNTQVIGHARLHPDGTLDKTFDTTVYNQNVKDVEIDADGKILVGGAFFIHRMLSQGTANFAEVSGLSFSVYPNPAKGEFRVRCDGKSQGNVQLEIRNMLGQIEYTTELETVKDSYEKLIVLPEELPAGNYLLRLVSSTASGTEILMLD